MKVLLTISLLFMMITVSRAQETKSNSDTLVYYTENRWKDQSNHADTVLCLYKIIQKDNSYYIDLEWIIYPHSSVHNYAAIPSAADLEFYFEDGRKATLEFETYHNGKIWREIFRTIYFRDQLHLSSDNKRKLSTYKLKSVRMQWDAHRLEFPAFTKELFNKNID
jgi:hypothetical protein